MQNSKKAGILMGTASHDTSYEGEVLLLIKAIFDDYGDKGTCVLIISKRDFNHGIFFHRILDRVCSTKAIAGFGSRMYTTLIPPYTF